MKYLLMILSLTLLSCKDSKKVAEVYGHNGLNGTNGKSCTTKRYSTYSLITCDDGTSSYIKDGLKGNTGSQGLRGFTGPQGLKGSTGLQGPKGDKGLKGDNGHIGPIGPQGLKGDKGEVGPTGPKGEDCNSCCVRKCLVTKAKNHVLWFSTGLPKDFIIISGGEFKEYADGTAKVTGVVASASNMSLGFKMDFHFSGKIESVYNGGTTPAGSPKTAPAGVDTDAWEYYTNFQGSLVGIGEYSGAFLKLLRMGPAFQVGNGGGVHSTVFGGASWFNYWTLSQPSQGHTFPNDSHGDLNVNINCK